MDLYDRCITGLRLTPVSTKAVDVAAVLYETVHPRLPAAHEVEVLPAHGGARLGGAGRPQAR